MRPPNFSFARIRSALAALQQPLFVNARKAAAEPGAKLQEAGTRFQHGRDFFRSKTPYLLALAASGGLGGLCMALADAPQKSSPVEGTVQQAQDQADKSEDRKKRVVILGSGWGATAVMQVSTCILIIHSILILLNTLF